MKYRKRRTLKQDEALVLADWIQETGKWTPLLGYAQISPEDFAQHLRTEALKGSRVILEDSLSSLGNIFLDLRDTEAFAGVIPPTAPIPELKEPS